MLKRIISIILTAAAAVAAISACGTPAKAPENDNSLKILMCGEKPEGFDAVETLAEEKLKTDGYGEYDLQFEFIPEDDDEYKDTMYVKLLAGADYDIVHDSTGKNFSSFAEMGMYIPLENYLNSGNYPNLKNMYAEETWRVQEDYYGHIYGLSRRTKYGNSNYVAYRLDWSNEWGIGEIDSYDKLYEYLNACREYMPDIVPIATKEDNGLSELLAEDRYEQLQNHVIKISSAGISYVYLNDTDTEVREIVYADEPLEAFDVLPERYHGASGTERENYTLWNEWSIFTDNDEERDIDDVKKEFTEGRAAAAVVGVSRDMNIPAELKKTDENAELGIWHMNSADFGIGKFYSELSVGECTCIPASSKKPEKALMFMEWLANDAYNENLFEFGIEGVNWEKQDDCYKKLKDENGENYKLSGKNLSYDVNNLMYGTGCTDEIKSVYERLRGLDNIAISPLAGFKFDSSNVSHDVQKINKLKDENYKDLKNGRIENPEEKISEMYAELEKAQEKVKKELAKQINEYLSGRDEE